MNEKRVFGTAASAGIGEGTVFRFFRETDFEHIENQRTSDAEKEAERIQAAIASAEKEIEGLLKEKSGLSDSTSAILEVQSLLLLDKKFTDKILSYVRDGYSAEYSLKRVVEDYVAHFETMQDVYLRERKNDIMSVGRRILQYLTSCGDLRGHRFTEPTSILAEDITPLELEQINQPNLVGVVLARGSVTSHEAVLSRSLEIPMIVGAVDAPEAIEQGDMLIVDGSSGLVLVHPTEESRYEYARRREDHRIAHTVLLRRKHEKVVSSDGKHFRVGGTAGSLADTKLAHSYGADHIGLLRTEFSLFAEGRFPREAEQVDMYSDIVAAMEGKPVTIRTFDAGGDKLTLHDHQKQEPNPFLGQRAIRLALRFEREFRGHVRAILRSSVHGPVKILIPLVTTVNELKTVLRIIDEEKETLGRQAKSFDPELEVGIMVEVPSALFVLPKLLKHVDFVSIGLNDLTQYILAADRNNPSVSDLYNPGDPSVLIAVRQIVRASRGSRRPVNVCGESVSHPEYLRLLLALEPDEVNVYPQAVPLIKETIRLSSIDRSKALLDQAIACETASEVEALINR